MRRWRLRLGGAIAAVLWLALCAQVQAITLTLVWDPPDNPQGLEYLVYSSTNGISFQPVAQVPETYLCLTGLAENEEYYFKVTSINQSGLESAPTEPLAYRTGFTGDLNDNQRFEVVDLLLGRLTLEEGEPPPYYPDRVYLGRGDLDDDGDFDAADLALMQDALAELQ
jgi:hypothetical protein